MRLPSRWLLLPVLSLALSACGVTPVGASACDSSCQGCCRDGQCLDGQTAQACGAGAAACDVCVAGQACTSGHCVTAGVDAGSCVPVSDTSLCASFGRACGSLDIVDNCVQQRHVSSCGTCTTPDYCEAGGTCHCVPESTTALCAKANLSCGAASLFDRCGAVHDIASCGGCAVGQQCSASGTCVCVPETNAELCTAAGRTCGPLTVTDRCGTARTIGACGAACATNYTCSAAGKCACSGETDLAFCTRMGKACGSASGYDLCGAYRTVGVCGTCANNNVCSSGVCACASETTAAFCTRMGATCGPTSGTDLCGNPKAVTSCGTCAGYTTCGGAGAANKCGCTPQTDAEYCLARGADCGTPTALDNCGVSRTPASCGTCTSPKICGGGYYPNVCACTSETNTTFCSRLAKNCGSVTALDNCNVSRTISCGTTCPAPSTCAGGGVANVCGCNGESDTAFCTRLGKTCGSVTALDSCNVSRTVTCGTGCTGLVTCGGGGVANVCGGRSEPMDPICGGGFCWDNPLPVGVTLWGAKTSPSGSNWVVGENGTVLMWTGAKWKGWFAVTPSRLMGVWPVSDTDVWAVGVGGVVMHYNGTSWSSVTSNTTQTLRGVWVAADGTVWAVGLGGTVIKQPAGGAFAAAGPVTSANQNAVFGLGARVFVVGKGEAWVLEAATWTRTGTPSTAWELLDVWGATASDVWAASVYGVMRFNGVTWTSSTLAKGNAIAGTSASNVWTLSDNGTVYKFNGLAWASSTLESNGGWVTSVYGLTANASDNTFLAVGASGALYRHDGTAWYRQTKGVSTLSPYVAYSSGVLQATTSDVFMAGSNASGNGTRYRCPGGAPCTVTSTGYGSPVVALASSGVATNVWSLDGATVGRFDGTTWVPQNSAPAGKTYVAIASTAATDAWVVGADRTVRSNGTTWSSVPNPTSSSTTMRLGAVAAVSTSLAWAGGNEGTLLQWDGANWTAINAGLAATQTIAQLTAASSTLVLAAGTFGVIRSTGGAWSPTAHTVSATSAWPESATAFWVIEAGKAKRYAGATGTDMTPWAGSANLGLSLVQVSGVSPTAVWVMGPYGELLHLQ